LYNVIRSIIMLLSCILGFIKLLNYWLMKLKKWLVKDFPWWRDFDTWHRANIVLIIHNTARKTQITKRWSLLPISDIMYNLLT
jgi:hypothetical protein